MFNLARRRGPECPARRARRAGRGRKGRALELPTHGHRDPRRADRKKKATFHVTSAPASPCTALPPAAPHTSAGGLGKPSARLPQHTTPAASAEQPAAPDGGRACGLGVGAGQPAPLKRGGLLKRSPLWGTHFRCIRSAVHGVPATHLSHTRAIGAAVLSAGKGTLIGARYPIKEAMVHVKAPVALCRNAHLAVEKSQTFGP